MARKTPLIRGSVLEVREPESGRLVYSFDIATPKGDEVLAGFFGE